MTQFRAYAKRGFLILLAATLLLGLNAALPADRASAANTYYVSRTGNNADGKSWATAWNELDQINWSVIRPGDIILVDGGKVACPPIGADYSGDSCGMAYNTTLKVNASGEPGNPITIRLAEEAGRNGTVIIDGGVVGPVYCPGYPGQQYPDFPVPSSPGSIAPNGANSVGVDLGYAQWVVVDGTKWGGIEVRNHYRIGFYFNRSQNSTARYLKIHHNRGSDWASGVTADYLSNYNTVSHSEMFGNGQDAIHLHGSNFVLEYSYLHDHFCYHPDGIQAFIGTASPSIPDNAGQIDNLIVRYNVFLNFRNIVDNSGYHGQGVFTGETGMHESWVNGAQVHDNLIVATAGSSIITKNANSTRFDVYNNTVVNAGGFGVNWTAGGATAPMSIHENVFYDADNGFWLLTSNGTTQFLNNCVYRAYNPGPADSITESGTIYQDPLFADMSKGDYSLLPGSPCSGMGSSITSVSQLLGQPMPAPGPTSTSVPAPTPTSTSVPAPTSTSTSVPAPTPTFTPAPLAGLAWEAEDGMISSPFTVSGGFVSQSVWTDNPLAGGRASYRFIITEPGDYVVNAVVDAPDIGRNSFHINIDGEPTTPMMVWDIPLTVGFEERAASWRGRGTEDNNEFVPRVFALTAGEHELIIRGREGETRLDRISLEPYVAPTATPTVTPVPPTPTETPLPPTPTDTATLTPLPPTLTATPTVTFVPPTPTDTATLTPVPPTPTDTATVTPVPPTPTDTPTLTPVPPTPTDTLVPVPPTPTDTATLAPVPPTATTTSTTVPEPTLTSPAPTSTPALLPGLSWEAESGVISDPFTVSGGSVSQPVWVDDPSAGGKASYRFVITEPGDYLVDVGVDAPDLNRNSFFVNIDGEPAAPMMIWDIPITKGFEKRAASWRGQGTEDNNEFVPRVFALTAGEHELIVRGREGETRFDRIGLESYVSPTPTDTPTAIPAPRAGDVIMYGRVYDAVAGIEQGIPGARLSLTMCLPGAPRTWTDADGNYRLLVSGPDLDTCLQTMVQVKADGYSPLSVVIPAPGLSAEPRRDFAMLPKGKPLGDVNADGAVNLFDLVIVSSAYDPEGPASDPSADVNSDGQVDLFDLVEVSSNYGSTAP